MAENKGRSAQEVGYGVKQLDQREDLELDATWRTKGMNARPVEIDNAAELHEDQALRSAHQKIKEIMEMGVDEGDLGGVPLGRLRQKNQLGVNDLAEGLTAEDLARAMGGMADASGHVATNLLHNSHQQHTPDESTLLSESYGQEPRNTGGAWEVSKFAAKLKSGKTVPVWKVVEGNTGMEVPKMFRIQEPAQRIATILNQTGNVNDKRIRGVMEAYDQHVKLMKHMRQLKEAVRKGRQDLRPKLQQVREQLEEVNWKLGI